MTQATVQDILETIQNLALEDQEKLVNLLQTRLQEQKKAALIRDVKEAQQEFAEGKCQPRTPEQLMEEILS